MVRLGIGSGNAAHRLVHVGIEHLARSTHALQARTLQFAQQLALHHLDPRQDVLGTRL